MNMKDYSPSFGFKWPGGRWAFFLLFFFFFLTKNGCCVCVSEFTILVKACRIICVHYK